MGDVPTAFVVIDPTRGDTLRLGDVAVRSSPASTYKIPHTLLALDRGRDTTARIPYDARRAPRQAGWPADWTQDQTLATAFRRSAVWAYQDLARSLGRPAAQAWLDTLGYGNRTIGAALDRYWLDGSLTISPLEQAAFVHRLATGRLPAEAAHQQAMMRLMRLDAGPDWVVYGKTGTTGLDSADPVEWLVGVVRVGAAADSGGHFVPYAFRQRPRSAAEALGRPERLVRVEALLRAAGVLPGQAPR